MDMEFERRDISCLKCLIRQSQYQEQTQEIRLPDGMGDAGQILGCWGQVVLRGKEWRTDTIACNGGVMAWVLYAPEDGAAPETLETWIPFQFKWDMNETMRDGNIRIQSLLRSIDARIVSARKLLVRCSVGAMAEAWQEDTLRLGVPGKLPEDVQLLTNRYPMRLPKLAGEKTFQMEEELSFPGTSPAPEKMIAYTLEPCVSDLRIVSGKLVFHGVGQLHLVYRTGEGKIHSWNGEIPISQFVQLDESPSQEAQGSIAMAVTALELDPDSNGRLHLKCTLLCQYLIDQREMLELVEDAYSTKYRLAPQLQMLEIPQILEQKQLDLPVRQTLRQTAAEIADVVYLPDLPQVHRGDETRVELPGLFQLLYYDENGVLRGASARTEENRNFPADPNSRMEPNVLPGAPAAAVPGSGIELKGECRLMLCTSSETPMPMITGIRLGEAWNDSDARPSLILRRAGRADLWSIAKETRSTVDQIRRANALETEPEADKILLIPVS